MKLGYQHLALVLLGKGDITGVVRAIEDASANGAGGESIDRRRALLLSSWGGRGSHKGVEPYRDSDDLETLNALGIALTDRGGPPRPCRCSRASSRSTPAGAIAYQNTGISLLKLNRIDEARQNLEAALRLGKRHARAWNALGVAWMRLGDPNKAIDAWETFSR